MDTFDIKRERRDLYAPKQGRFALVDVPEMAFLMVDGRGDPNTASSYRHAIEALYKVSYGVRSLAKRQLGRVHTVAPLEGLWSAEDHDAFLTGDKSSWDWTMMITQPDWITAGLVGDAVTAAARKDLAALELVRFERYAEGRSVQTLHVGSYDDEAPVLERLHREYLPEHDLRLNGRHHEIYLSDPRRVQAARLKTILRQPVAAAG